MKSEDPAETILIDSIEDDPEAAIQPGSSNGKSEWAKIRKWACLSLVWVTIGLLVSG